MRDSCATGDYTDKQIIRFRSSRIPPTVAYSLGSTLSSFVCLGCVSARSASAAARGWWFRERFSGEAPPDSDPSTGSTRIVPDVRARQHQGPPTCLQLCVTVRPPTLTKVGEAAGDSRAPTL